MKRIIMFFLFTGSLYPLVAQTTDSTRASSTDSTKMMNNSGMKTDSTTSGSNMSSMSPATDTMHNMNNSSNSNMSNMTGSGMNNSTSSMMNNSMSAGAPAALPVIENSVPDGVVAKAKDKFGATLYDITCVKHAADQNAYVVRVQTNGVYSTQWIDDSGNTMQ